MNLKQQSLNSQIDETPTLYIVGTPIGNLQDITHRALAVLASVKVLVCEDTRTTRKILTNYGISRPPVVFSAQEYNERRAAERILQYLNQGESVAFTSDAGMPCISDPGFLLIREARKSGFKVEVVPGPSAVTTALVASGLPCNGFVFLGFPPRKKGPRRRLFERLVDMPETLIFFESPHRLGAFLTDALAVFGDRLSAVTNDLTKMFESVEQDWLSLLADRYANAKPRGEISVVIAGNSHKFIRSSNSECNVDSVKEAEI